MKIDRKKIEQAVRLLLQGIGEDPTREGLRETPRRVADFYEDFFKSSVSSPETIVKTHLHEKYDELVLIKNISLFSLCEHHILPFIGKIHIAYIPDKGRLVGLSKLIRIVDFYTKKLQIQERLTEQIADTIQSLVKPMGTMVVIEAEHLCLTMRGVKRAGSVVVTSAVRGIFRKEQKTRAETLALIKSQ